MKVDRETLRRNYSATSDDNLLSLHARGELTDLALECLETELESRGLQFASRPKPENSLESAAQSRPNSIRAHWAGTADLGSAYWMYGVFGSVVLTAIGFGLQQINESWAAILMIILGLLAIPYFVFVCVAIWRCAWNSKWKGWGYIARTLVVIGALRFVAEFFDAFDLI